MLGINSPATLSTAIVILCAPCIVYSLSYSFAKLELTIGYSKSERENALTKKLSHENLASVVDISLRRFLKALNSVISYSSYR